MTFSAGASVRCQQHAHGLTARRATSRELVAELADAASKLGDVTLGEPNTQPHDGKHGILARLAELLTERVEHVQAATDRDSALNIPPTPSRH